MKKRVDYTSNGHTHITLFKPTHDEVTKIQSFLTERGLDKEDPLTLIDSICIFKLMDKKLCTRSS